MPKIQIDYDDKELDKKIAIYKINNNFKTKAEVIVHIIKEFFN